MEPAAGYAPWSGLRHRDFILRHEEARARAQAAAMDGEEQYWEDDVGAYSDPASMKAMLAMPMPKVGETKEQDCAVCLEEFVFVAGGMKKKKLRMMPCSHSFHQSCIWDWLLINRRCPLCRLAMLPRSVDDEKEATTSEQVAGNSTEECPSTEPDSHSL